MYLLIYWFKNAEETNKDFGTATSPVDSIEIKDSELKNESNSPEQDIDNVDDAIDAIDENESSVLDQDTPQSGKEDVPIGDVMISHSNIPISIYHFNLTTQTWIIH